MCSGSTSTAIVNSFFTASNSHSSLLQVNARPFYNKMQTMHSSTGPNTLIMTDILHDDILSMNIVSDKHEQASQSGWLGLHLPPAN